MLIIRESNPFEISKLISIVNLNFKFKSYENYTKASIFLTWQSRTKFVICVYNDGYIKPIAVNFKTFAYNSNNQASKLSGMQEHFSVPWRRILSWKNTFRKWVYLKK